MAKIRLRFHATGPDGRQVGPVDVDVPVQVAGLSVVFVASSDPPTVVAYWGFSGEVVTDGVPDPAMKIGGVGPVSALQAAPSVVQCTYPGTVSPGDAWSIDAALIHLASSPPVAFPQSGLLILPD